MPRRLALALLPLLLANGQAPTKQPHPWDVPSAAPVVTREVVFESQGARLSGTLYLPAGGRPTATVIALHGAQAPLRSEPLYRHLPEMLTPLGMAVFLYDRRGSGRSEQGKAAQGDFDVLTADAVAAFKAMAQQPGIDPRKIGYWGLSQGGWLTLLAAAAEPRAAFAISASAPMAGADVQMNFAMANLLRVRGYPETVVQRAIAARKAIDDFARGRITREQAVAAERSIAGEPWYREIYLKGNIDDPVWRKQIESDPVDAIRKSRVPTLILYGQGDPWVPVGDSLKALSAMPTRHPDLTVRVIDGADHGMEIGVDPKLQMDLAYAKAVAPDAPAYFATVAAWLERRGLTRR